MKRKPLTALWEVIGFDFGRKTTAIHAVAERSPSVSVGCITIVWQKIDAAAAIGGDVVPLEPGKIVLK